MATIKSYTDINQSKKLAEILPLESADMRYHTISHYNPHPCGEIVYTVELGKASNIDVPCWSLAALLNILDYPQLSKDKLGGGKEGWMVSTYPNNCRYDSSWHDNPIDCCIEMIYKLYQNEMKSWEWKPWEWDSEKGCSYPSCQISK